MADGSARGRLSHSIGLSVALTSLWLLLSGHYTPLILSLGALSILLVVLISRRMSLVDSESMPIQLEWRAFLYWFWLYGQILQSNWDVLKRLCQRKMDVSPTLFTVKAGQRSDLGRVIYANSITLTPGTVTLKARGEDFLVHALSQAGADALTAGEMDRRVIAIEGSDAAKAKAKQ